MTRQQVSEAYENFLDHVLVVKDLGDLVLYEWNTTLSYMRLYQRISHLYMLDTPPGYPPIPYDNKAFVKVTAEVAENPNTYMVPWLGRKDISRWVDGKWPCGVRDPSLEEFEADFRETRGGMVYCRRRKGVLKGVLPNRFYDFVFIDISLCIYNILICYVYIIF